MNLRVLEYVIATSDHGSVTRAAAALRMSQPALSKAIHQLEEEWGTQLFHRVGRGLVLTEAGALLVQDGRALLKGAERLTTRVRAAGGADEGRLILAAPPDGAVDTLPQLLGRLHEERPKMRVTILRCDGELGVLDQVRLGGAEIGLTWVEPPETVESQKVGELELMAVFPPGTELESTSVTLREIAKYPLITRLDALRTYTMSIPAESLSQEVRIETSVPTLVVPLVLAGEGVAFMERGNAERASLSGAIIAPLAPRLRFSLWLLHRKDSLTPPAAAFRDIALNSLTEGRDAPTCSASE